AIGFTNDHAASPLQPDNRSRVVGWMVVREELRSARSTYAFGDDYVLYCDGNSRELSGIFPTRDPVINRAGRSHRPLGREWQVCIRLRVFGLGVGERVLGQFLGAECLVEKSSPDGLNGQTLKRTHRSITLGTL